MRHLIAGLVSRLAQVLIALVLGYLWYWLPYVMMGYGPSWLQWLH